MVELNVFIVGFMQLIILNNTSRKIYPISPTFLPTYIPTNA